MYIYIYIHIYIHICLYTYVYINMHEYVHHIHHFILQVMRRSKNGQGEKNRRGIRFYPNTNIRLLFIRNFRYFRIRVISFVSLNILMCMLFFNQYTCIHEYIEKNNDYIYILMYSNMYNCIVKF
jgi:hypothetical protein